MKLSSNEQRDLNKETARRQLTRGPKKTPALVSVHYLGIRRQRLSKLREALRELGINTFKVVDISFVGDSV